MCFVSKTPLLFRGKGNISAPTMASVPPLLLLLLFFSFVDSANILVMVPQESRSHFNVFLPIIRELSSRQHNVTVQTFHDPKLPNVNVLPLHQSKHIPNPAERKNILLRNIKTNPLMQMIDRKSRFQRLWDLYLKEPSTQTLLANGKQYDLAIVDALYADLVKVVASVVAEHVVEGISCNLYPWRQTDLPMPPSYVPNTFDLTTDRMTFWERLQNSLITLGLVFIINNQMITAQEKVLHEHFPRLPTIETAEKSVVLTITNSDPVVDIPRPTMANVVNCGGMHCEDPTALPKELNDFVESSGEEGFIIFGLGSNIHSSFLPSEFHHAVVSAFARLKQKVIWKYDSDVEDLPSNVKIVKWMPQQDLLGHPKIRLFITHAGLLSLQETIYHGVPVIGIPFFGDQPGNIARIQQLGIGRHLHFFDITADVLYEHITEMLLNKSYTENVKRYSLIMRNQPQKPVDRAVFWIEYVIRHNGAPHLRSAAEDLNFFQYFLLDVMVFMCASAAILLGTCFWVGRKILYRSKSVGC